MDDFELRDREAGLARPQIAQPPAARSLHSAAGAGDCRVLARLLRRSRNLEDCGHWGTPPLHLAAFSGHVDAVALLLSAGARVNARDYAKMTPLHRAVAAGRQEIVALLLQNGAKVNRRCKEGRSPLHVAAADCKKAAIAEALLDGGADAWLRDRELSQMSGAELEQPQLQALLGMLASLGVVTGDSASEHLLGFMEVPDRLHPLLARMSHSPMLGCHPVGASGSSVGVSAANQVE